MALSTAALLPAGGRGLRAGGETPKQFQRLLDARSLLEWTVDRFLGLDLFSHIVVILPGDQIERWKGLRERDARVSLVEGGTQRWLSVKNGFESLPAGVGGVLVHDVARPYFSRSLIDACLAGLAEGRCAIAALPCTDTIKQIEGEKVRRTLDRSELIQVQTPQAFPAEVLRRAYASITPEFSPTDEAALVESVGCEVEWVRGSEWNRKITAPEDMQWAQWIAGRVARGEIDLDE